MKTPRNTSAIILIALALFSTYTFLQFGFVKNAYGAVSVFGYDTIGTAGSTTVENVIVGSTFTITNGGTATGMGAYLKPSSQWSGNTKCAIYRHSDLSLIGNTTETAVSGTLGEGWYTYTFSVQPSLVNGTEYLLVVWAQSKTGTCLLVYDSGSTNQGHANSAIYGTWPNPMASASHSNFKYSVYCNYTIQADQLAPTYSSVASSTVIPSAPCSLSANWVDDTGLSYYILSHNNTGTFANTTVSFGASPSTAWSNQTVTLNSSVGNIVQWKYYANDTSNNWNSTMPWQNITVTAIPTGYWVAPNGYVDSNSSWTTETSAYDLNASSYALGTLWSTGTDYLILNTSQIMSTAIKIKIFMSTIVTIAVYNGSWITVLNSVRVSPDTFYYTVQFSVNQVTAARINFSDFGYLFEFYFWKIESYSLANYLTSFSNAITWTDNIYTAYLGYILGTQTVSDLSTAFWNLPLTTSAQGMVVLYWAAILRKLGVENQTKVQWALDNVTIMANGLPQTGLDALHSNKAFFSTYDRYAILGYYWADKYAYDTGKWNKTMAYANFDWTMDHATLPVALYVYYDNTTWVFNGATSPRYYDEAAQSLDVYQEFYDAGVTAALDKALNVWNVINNILWVSAYPEHYTYVANSTADLWECEAGSFLQVITKLFYYYGGSLGNYSRISVDMFNRFLAENWSSPQWYNYVVVHARNATDNSLYNAQKRLANTVIGWSALTGFYPRFNSTAQGTIRTMLEGSAGTDPAWLLLMNNTGELFNAPWGFSSFSDAVVDSNATAVGLSLMFMQGIVPNTATLAVPLEEFTYEYPYSMLDGDLFNVSLSARTVTLSLLAAGTVDFLFGNLTTYAFADKGVYRVSFASDWSSISAVTYLGSLPTNRKYLAAPTPHYYSEVPLSFIPSRGEVLSKIAGGAVAEGLSVLGKGLTTVLKTSVTALSLVLSDLRVMAQSVLGWVSGTFSPDSTRAWVLTRFSIVPASLAIIYLASGLQTALRFYGAVAESVILAGGGNSLLSRRGTLSYSLGAASTRFSAQTLSKSVAEAFSALGARANSLSRSLSLAASFIAHGLDAMVFQRFGASPMSFALNSVKGASTTIGKIVSESFTVASGRLDSLQRLGATSLSALLSGQRSLLERVSGGITEAFNVGTLHYLTVLKYALTPLTIAVHGVASGLYGAIFTVYSSILMLVSLASGRVLSVGQQGNVAELFSSGVIHSINLVRYGLETMSLSVTSIASGLIHYLVRYGLVPAAFALSGIRSLLEGVGGVVAGSLGVASTRMWVFAKHALLSLTYPLSDLASKTASFAGVIVAAFASASRRVMEMLDLGSVSGSLGVLAGRATSVLKLSEVVLALAMHGMSVGLPTFLTFFGSIIGSFNLGSVGSNFMVPYGTGVGDLAMTFFAVAISVPFALGIGIVFLKKRKRLESADQL